MKKLLLTFYILSPMTAFAAADPKASYIGKLIIGVGKLIKSATVILAGLALLVFLWGVVKFIFKAGDKKAVDEGKSLMMWGIIALFVMFAAWGLVSLLGNVFGVPVPVENQAQDMISV